ncbi:MAG TPA: AMIN domain-containing protein, partial [Acidobacteriaceae bacterium]|nr:AMIN domain-containing protein [Acidobacteriaceae bacterium]
MATHTTKRLLVTLLLVSTALPCAAKNTKKKILAPYDAAVATRTALPAQPTRAQYNAVMDQFRAIYHKNPADLHAPDSIIAVAELLTQAGEQLNDKKLSQNAVGQYEFLRKNYPASHYRADALMAEAAIEANDLNDRPAAKAKYAELIKTYPHSDKAPEAQADLIVLKHGQRIPSATTAANAPAPPAVALPPSETASSPPVDTVLPAFDSGVKTTGPPALITGIRHWSTASYTRVAIDLSDEVQYEAARVPHPDRIYFDLHGAKLSPELAGKTFDVTDDGFLKKIRAAQFSDGVIRIVLDVNDVTDYSAFLLPNPYRLIIDIHGGSAAANAPAAPAGTASNVAAAAALQTNPELAQERTGTSHPSGDVALDAATGSAPASSTSVPNTTSHRTHNTGDVASLSAQPGKVQATAAPTSKPIAATVPQSELVTEMSGNQNGDADNVNVAPVPDDTTPPLTTRHGKHSKTAAAANMAPAEPAHEADPTADG